MCTVEPHAARLPRVSYGEVIVWHGLFHGICSAWYVEFTVRYDYVVPFICATIQYKTVAEVRDIVFLWTGSMIVFSRDMV